MPNKYLRGAGDTTAEDRARIFRLGWDFAGTTLVLMGSTS